MSRLEYVNISGNCGKFTILAVTCLRSCENITTVVAHGHNFSPDELLFLTKTFDSVARGTMELETEDGFNAFSVFRSFEDDLYEDLF